MKSGALQRHDGQPSEELKDICAELSNLFHQQNDALENAVFMGMTDEQSKAFEKRRERIMVLTARLKEFKEEA